ncbi:MAG: DNA-directed RNA polymerase subunit P [Candidatus Thermoplasmatota archaeon]|nr:DNA-directed RNA polymerase subunit P [Candidatus Thermoplasmatota archaeon]
MSELVDYKCVLCGTHESFDRERNGIHCSHCGCKIFMKLRRSSGDRKKKTLKAE